MLPCQGDSLSGSVRYILVFRVYFISSRDWHRSVEWKKVLTLGKCWCVYLLVGCCIVCVVRVGARASGLAAPLVLLFETTPIDALLAESFERSTKEWECFSTQISRRHWRAVEPFLRIRFSVFLVILVIVVLVTSQFCQDYFWIPRLVDSFFLERTVSKY